jgi:predicted component of type VI protein secretion system
MTIDAKKLLVEFKKTLKCKRIDHMTPAEIADRIARVKRLAKLRETNEPMEIPLT